MKAMQFTVTATLLLVGLGASSVSSAGSIKGAVVLNGPVPAQKKSTSPSTNMCAAPKRIPEICCCLRARS